jgi:hypoxanthine phosphoribosyltransferase
LTVTPGEIYLTASEIGERVAGMAAEIGRDYTGREPVLVSPLRSSLVFPDDLSAALPLPHTRDVVQLERYAGGRSRSVRLVRDLERPIEGLDVIVVDHVVDTGLTLNAICRTLRLHGPRSLAVATLLDRPYRRLVDDLPVRYVGFTVPDELFVGYGFDLDERFRNLPDLHVLRAAS